MMYDWGGSWGGGWFPGMMGAMGLLWVVVLILVVFFFVRYLTRRSDWDARRHGGSGHDGGASSDGGNALNILRERYARGEISQEEYQRIMDDLTNHR